METKRFKIEDVILDISMGPFGSDIKKEVYTDSGVPVLNGSNLQGFELVEDSFGYVTEEKADSLKKANAHRGDIVITHRGTIGQIVYIPQNSKFERYVISQSQFRVTCNKDIVLPEYMTYYFHTREGQYKLLSNASQVGVPALARASTTFRKLEIDLPSIEIQRKAIDIILELQQKIAVNRRICANLEAQAQALFKHWFIDFAPFKDGKFVESELGMIPEGWRVGKLGEIADITMGQSPSGSSYNEEGNGSIFYQGRSEFGFRFPSIRLFTTEPKRYAEPLSTLLSVRAPVGDINVATIKCCIGRGLAAIKSKSYHSSYILYLLKSLRRRFDVYNGEGTVFGSINKDTLNGLNIVIPPNSAIREFNDIVQVSDSEILESHNEDIRLQALRDTLLPRLMSGQIKL